MASRGIESLKRVIWRLKENPKEFYLVHEIEMAIMYECGTDPRTVDVNMMRLRQLKWIKGKGHRWYIADQDFY